MNKKTEKLYPGETNQLLALTKILGAARNLIEGEVERLKKLRKNPTFPESYYQTHLAETEKLATWIAESAKDARL